MPFKLEPIEMIIILTMVILIFGVGKLPELGQTIGKMIREFRAAHEGNEATLTSDAPKGA